MCVFYTLSHRRLEEQLLFSPLEWSLNVPCERIFPKTNLIIVSLFEKEAPKVGLCGVLPDGAVGKKFLLTKSNLFTIDSADWKSNRDSITLAESASLKVDKSLLLMLKIRLVLLWNILQPFLYNYFITVSAHPLVKTFA